MQSETLRLEFHWQISEELALFTLGSVVDNFSSVSLLTVLMPLSVNALEGVHMRMDYRSILLETFSKMSTSSTKSIPSLVIMKDFLWMWPWT
jgi:hypothetical protein